MRSTFTLLILAVSFSLGYSQTFSFPTLAANGKTINDFIPKGWFLKDSTAGDLNGDDLQDVAFVIQLKDSATELRPDSQLLDSNPRILVILFNRKTSYALAVQNNTFVLREGEGGMVADPYDKINIAESALNLRFQFTRTWAFYKFMFRSNSICLVGATSGGSDGNSKIELWYFDFLTKKAKHTIEPIGAGEQTEERKDIPFDKLKTLKELKQPFMWEIFPYVYI